MTWNLLVRSEGVLSNRCSAYSYDKPRQSLLLFGNIVLSSLLIPREEPDLDQLSQYQSGLRKTFVSYDLDVVLGVCARVRLFLCVAAIIDDRLYI